MTTNMKRSLTGILLTAGLMCLVSTLVFSAEFNFVGTWKGELAPVAPTASGGTTPSGATATGGGTPTDSGTTGGGGRTKGGGGFGGGGFGGGATASNKPQKITLRVKVNKDKPTGNFTFGTSAAEDIKEGRIDGNKLTFKTGLAPATIYDYEAVLIGEDLSVTRTAEGGRGGKPTLFTLMRSK
ncbi:MAG TPA: hypothetical protein VK210_02890 [Terriglobia bacterium]|nr:hypothetical protein [Terriglobia bacterium]